MQAMWLEPSSNEKENKDKLFLFLMGFTWNPVGEVLENFDVGRRV